jgi:hypothetical protein
MKILLINIDSRFNIAIRRMYNYYLQQGHEVDLKDLGFSAYPHQRTKKIDAANYDKVFISNIFEINKDRVSIENCDDVTIGGIGSNKPENKLPQEIEAVDPFYFPKEDVSYGFITRGCIRNCWFCKVPTFEGRMQTYNSVEKVVYSNPNFKRVSFMDNNILAHVGHLEIFDWLIERNIKCDFNQGLDFRLVNDTNLEKLANLNYFGNYIFAFDDPKYEAQLTKKIALMKKYIPAAWRFKFYIYFHPKMDINLALKRVEWCRQNECLPYLMRDAACWECEDKNFLIDFTAYCNQPAFFKKMHFGEFLFKRAISDERATQSLKRYNEIVSSSGGNGLNVWNTKENQYK